MFRIFTPLAAALCLMLTALATVPPAAAQTRAEVPFERVDTDLRERLLRAARVQGLRLGDGTMVEVATRNCPSNCNSNTLAGMCYCSLDAEGNCPSGTTRTNEPRSDRRCKVLPTTAAVTGPGIPPRTVLRP